MATERESLHAFTQERHRGHNLNFIVEIVHDVRYLGSTHWLNLLR